MNCLFHHQISIKNFMIRKLPLISINATIVTSGNYCKYELKTWKIPFVICGETVKLDVLCVHLAILDLLELYSLFKSLDNC